MLLVEYIINGNAGDRNIQPKGPEVGSEFFVALKISPYCKIKEIQNCGGGNHR